MKSKPKLELGLTAYEELFMNDKQLTETRLAKIYEIALTKVSTKSKIADLRPEYPYSGRFCLEN